MKVNRTDAVDRENVRIDRKDVNGPDVHHANAAHLKNGVHIVNAHENAADVIMKAEAHIAMDDQGVAIAMLQAQVERVTVEATITVNGKLNIQHYFQLNLINMSFLCGALFQIDQIVQETNLRTIQAIQVNHPSEGLFIIVYNFC